MNLDNYKLSGGAHESPEHGMCVMEMVSYVAMEPWSDSPACTSPALAAYCRAFNDSLLKDDRQRLKGYIHRLVGLRNDDLEMTLAFMCADRAVRVFAPKVLRAAGMESEAAGLEALEPVTDEKSAYAVNAALYTAAYAVNAAAYAANAEGFTLLEDMIALLEQSRPDQEAEILARIEALPELVTGGA